MTNKTPGISLKASHNAKIAHRCLSHYSTNQSSHGDNDSNTNGDGDVADNESITVTPTTAKQAMIAYPMKPLEEAEKEARDKTEKRPFVLFLINTAASLYVFVVYLISLESILSIILG